MKTNEKEILRYGDLTAKGYGSSVTIWRNVKNFKFPPPDADDGNGHPVWFPETIKKHRESLESYSPSPVKSSQQVTGETI